MYYVTKTGKPFSVPGWGDNKLYDEIIVVDTDTNVSTTYNNKKVVETFYNSGLKLYGCYFYGKNSYEMYAFAKAIKLNTTFSKSKMESLAKDLKAVHNPWTLYPIVDYLASLNIGTIFTVTVTDRDTSGQIFQDSTRFSKVGTDIWNIDSDWIVDGNYTSEQVANHLDYPLCTKHSISVQNT